MIGALCFFVGLIATVWFTKRWWLVSGARGTEFRPLQAVFSGVGAVVIALVCGTLGGAVLIVDAGHRVVVFDNIKGVRPVALREGINFIMPFVQDAIEFDVRVQKVEFDATAASKDLQDVATKVTLNFHPVAENVPELYRNYGPGYAEKVIHPAVQESLKAVTSKYTAEELITKREEVKNAVQAQLAAMMEPAKLMLDATYITDFKFSEAFSHAIEQKQVAEQDALRARRDLDRVKLESEQKISQLRAEAEGLRMQKEQITPQLIELRRVEKWDGHYPQVMMGGAVPLMNMGDLTGRREK